MSRLPLPLLQPRVPLRRSVAVVGKPSVVPLQSALCIPCKTCAKEPSFNLHPPLFLLRHAAHQRADWEVPKRSCEGLLFQGTRLSESSVPAHGDAPHAPAAPANCCKHEAWQSKAQRVMPQTWCQGFSQSRPRPATEPNESPQQLKTYSTSGHHALKHSLGTTARQKLALLRIRFPSPLKCEAPNNQAQSRRE